MEYTVSMSYNDKYNATHTVTKRVYTAEDGAYCVYDMIEDVMIGWPSIDPNGVNVIASVTSDDGDFCDTYDFKFGM